MMSDDDEVQLFKADECSINCDVDVGILPSAAVTARRLDVDGDQASDRALLLRNGVKRRPRSTRAAGMSRLRYRCSLLRTLFLCLAFFGVGLCLAIPGPTLLELQAQTNTSTDDVSYIFTGRSIGYLMGSIVGGVAFDRLNHEALLGLSLLLSACGTILVPWSPTLGFMVAVFSFTGFSMGILDTGGNVLCLSMWKDASAPYMQALHFSFGLGAFVAPLVAEPFLSTVAHAAATDHPLLPAAAHLGGVASRPLAQQHIKPLVRRDAGMYLIDATDMPTAQFAANTTLFTSTASVLAIVEDVNKTEETLKKPISDARVLSNDKHVADGSVVREHLESKEKGSQVAAPSGAEPTAAATACAPATDGNATLPANGTTPCAASPLATSASPTPTTTPLLTTSTAAPTSTAPPAPTTSPPAPSSTSPPFVAPSSTTPPLHFPAPAGTLNNSLADNTTDSADGFSTIQRAIDNVYSGVIELYEHVSTVRFAYLIVGLFLLVLSLAFWSLCCCARVRPEAAAPVAERQPAALPVLGSTGFVVQTMVLLFMLYFLYVGMEVTYGNFVMTFSHSFLHWPQSKGAMLTSVFWGSFALLRGLSIPISNWLSPSWMLSFDFLTTFVSLMALIFAVEHYEIVLWLGTAGLGAGMASIFPTGITWAERYMTITGKKASVFVVGSALGEMAIPVATGFLMENKSPMCLLYVLFACTMLSIVLYIVLENLAVSYHFKRYGSSVAVQVDEPSLLAAQRRDSYLAPGTKGNSAGSYSDDLVFRRSKVAFRPLPAEPDD